MKCRRVEILAVAVVLFVCTSPVFATIHFKDGGIHNIDYEINDKVYVDYGAPGMETTVNLLGGGKAFTLFGYKDSYLNILGGSTGELEITDNCQITVSGGSMAHLRIVGNNQATVSGGSMGQLLAWGISSEVTVFGGSIGDGLFVDGGNLVDIFGGSIGGKLISGIWTSQTAAKLTIHGWDFAVDGEPFGYGQLTSIYGGSFDEEPRRHLTGTLASGEPIDNDFYIGLNGKIVLVPEPASAVMLGLGSLFLALRRRRRQD